MKKEQVYQGPIIEVRGILRLALAGLPFLIGAYFSDDPALWGFGFIVAAFATAGFIGIDTEEHRAPRYALWVAAFLLMAVYSAWFVSEHPLIMLLFVVGWSLLSSLSFSAGPIVSLPVNIGCLVYFLLLLGHRLEHQAFAELAFFTIASVGLAYLLGKVSWLQGKKNALIIPTVRQAFGTMSRQLNWQSTYTRTGVVRGIAIIVVAILFLIFGSNTGFVITMFTILIAMQPGRSQTLVKVASRVGAAFGAVFAGSVIFNAQPPYWVYVLAAVVALAFTRWVLLRKYTYNSFFLITFPLFLVSLTGFSESGPNKIWFTLLGGAIAVIASELFVFRGLNTTSRTSTNEIVS